MTEQRSEIKPPSSIGLLRALTELERGGARMMRETASPLPNGILMALIRAAEARADTFETMAEERQLEAIQRYAAEVGPGRFGTSAAESVAGETLDREEIKARLSDALEKRDDAIRNGAQPISPRPFVECILELCDKERRA